MSDGTAIEWADATWNPVRGCTRVSEGCTRCYAERVAARFSGPGMPYDGLAKMTPSGPRWTGEVRVVEKALDQPLRWTRPRRIFVNSMSDLFHDGLTDEQIAAVFGVMAAAPQHTFQVLTKRPERMKKFFEQGDPVAALLGAAARAGIDVSFVPRDYSRKQPLHNVWLGVSVEDQDAADERIPLLLQTPAAVRFLSCEPLLGPVDLERWVFDRRAAIRDAMNGPAALNWDQADSVIDSVKIGWVIAGGESGPGARPMHPDWARALRDQCADAGVPYFFKQWGAWAPHRPAAGGDLGGDLRSGRVLHVCRDRDNDGHFRSGDVYMRLADKHVTGCTLDGVEHKHFPVTP